MCVCVYVYEQAVSLKDLSSMLSEQRERENCSGFAPDLMPF